MRVTINGYTYRSTVAMMGGVYMVGVSAEHRQHAGVAGGDKVDVDIELDTAPREVALPADFVAALAAAPAARDTFDRLSYSNRSWHVLQVTGARSDENPSAPDCEVDGDLEGGPSPLSQRASDSPVVSRPAARSGR